MFVVRNFINGEFRDFPATIDSYEPATGKVWANVPNSDANEVNAAVLAAKNAFSSWSSTPIRDRSAYLLRIADILEEQLDEFASLESKDQGKTITQAKIVEIPRAVHNCRFFATAALHDITTSTYQEHFGALNYTIRMPIGVAGLISPWNLPLYLLTFKLAPAIVNGNTVVIKPSEMTSVTAYKLCEVLQKAKLPAGVVNMVFGTGPLTGELIVKHPDIPLISFTGSTVIGQRIQMVSAPFCKKLSLELGGKNACIIFDDADLAICVPTVIRSSFANQGEICLCTSRIYVQRQIFDEFLQKFIDAAKQLKVTDPQDSTSQMGALISREHKEKVLGYIRLARSEGCSIVCGEVNENTDDERADELKLNDRCHGGYFVRPTVITAVTDNSRLMQEEIFGPVTCVVPFDCEEEVLSRANGVPYGLCACVWTQNAKRLHRVSRGLNVGTVWANCWLVRDLNMPFGGTKMSGIGREGFHESTEFFTEIKTVCTAIN